MTHTYTMNADTNQPEHTVEADGYVIGDGYFHFRVGGGHALETVFSIATERVQTVRRS